MARTSLNQYLRKNVQVELKTLRELTEMEKREIAYTIQNAFTWVLVGEPPPTLNEIKMGVGKTNPMLAQQIVGGQYRYKRYC